LEEPKKKYDLEERTEKFSISTRNLCVRLKKDVINTEYIRQLVRSAGSVAANYIEANENLGPKDFKKRSEGKQALVKAYTCSWGYGN